MPHILRLALQDIELDTRLQPRATINEEKVQEYTERLATGDTFPAVVVFHDGATYWLADGFHRFYAHREHGASGIQAQVHNGTFDDALEYSVGANAKHGIPRSRADTRRAIENLLRTEKWVGRSDNWIADVVVCNIRTVQNTREQMETTLQITKLDTLTGQDGKERPRTNGRKSGSEPELIVFQEPVQPVKDTLPEPIVPPVETHHTVTNEDNEPEPEPDFTTEAPGYSGPVAPAGGFLLSEWHELTAQERDAAVLLRHQPTKLRFNEQKDQDNIEWARWSWNPITGCKHNCIYCYARDIAQRFYSQEFEPTIIPERLAIPYSMKPPEVEGPGYRNVFTCSMADLWGRWVPQDWIDAVLKVVTDNPQWNFLMLTKFPGRMAEQDWPANAWVGTSVDTQARVAAAEKAFAKVQAGVKWLSCEPLLEPLQFTSLEMFDWVVIGGQTRSTQAPEFQPKWEWIEDLLWQARQAGCKVYFKTNLLNRPREYPTNTAYNERG
jgi:protein gp37